MPWSPFFKVSNAILLIKKENFAFTMMNKMDHKNKNKSHVMEPFFLSYFPSIKKRKKKKEKKNILKKKNGNMDCKRKRWVKNAWHMYVIYSIYIH